MITLEQKASALTKRLAPLVLPEETLISVAKDTKKNQRVILSLYKEWMGDAATWEQKEYNPALRDPETHFRRWLETRIDNLTHVSDTILNIVTRRYNIDFTTKFYLIVWPQEIAWAQRYRLSSNPFTAAKAGFFLAKAEADKREVFENMAEIYADAQMTSKFIYSPLRDMSPEEIRFSDQVPDFTPLFLDYTQQFLMKRLSNLTSEQVGAMAQNAGRMEKADRLKGMTTRALQNAVDFPMVRELSTLSVALAMKISANELFLLEKIFLDKVRDGGIALQPGSSTPQTTFVTMLSDREQRRALLKEAEILYAPRFTGEDAYRIVTFNRRWIDELPEGFGYLSNLMHRLGSWQTEVLEEHRPLPYDAVSDFGYFVLEQERRV